MGETKLYTYVFSIVFNMIVEVYLDLKTYTDVYVFIYMWFPIFANNFINNITDVRHTVYPYMILIVYLITASYLHREIVFTKVVSQILHLVCIVVVANVSWLYTCILIHHIRYHHVYWYVDLSCFFYIICPSIASVQFFCWTIWVSNLWPDECHLRNLSRALN